MLLNELNKIQKRYNKTGYVVLKNYFTPKYLKKISLEISDYKKLKCNNYLDRSGKIRRLEKFYNKTSSLIFLNKRIEKLLKKIFKEKYIIFKDKFNLKPPKGEGFSAHYDGIFYFYNNKKKYPGWYKYAKNYVNVLITFDKSYSKNGTIQIAEEDKFSFIKLIKNTKLNGTPDLTAKYEKQLKLKSINLNIGDLCIFSNRCAHRSGKNRTKKNRRILYYTYNKKVEGNFYKKYFSDKNKSKSKFKSLSGQI